MADKLSESAKKIGQTRRNSEAALRRYNAVHPRLERVRDVFDDTIPFEMEFNTENADSTFHMDLYFNKPPPLAGGCNGRYDLPCAEFVKPAGDHLIQVTARYKPGSIVVFRNGTMLLGGQFSEYDPVNGLVYVQGLSTSGSVFNICYIVDSFIAICDGNDLLTRPIHETIFPAGTFSLNNPNNLSDQYWYREKGNELDPPARDYGSYSVIGGQMISRRWGQGAGSVDTLWTKITLTNPNELQIRLGGSITYEVPAPTNLNYPAFDQNVIIRIKAGAKVKNIWFKYGYDRIGSSVQYVLEETFLFNGSSVFPPQSNTLQPVPVYNNYSINYYQKIEDGMTFPDVTGEMYTSFGTGYDTTPYDYFEEGIDYTDSIECVVGVYMQGGLDFTSLSWPPDGIGGSFESILSQLQFCPIGSP